MREYLVAVDIATKRDRYAEMVWKDIARVVPGNPILGNPDRVVHEYPIVWIRQAERLRYEEMEESALSLVNRPELKNNCDFLIDATGVGDPEVEHIRKRGAYPIPIIFTNGGEAHPVFDDVSRVFGKWDNAFSSTAKTLKQFDVPKRDLVDAGKLMLEMNRVIIPKKLKGREPLIAQLNGFRGKVNEQTKRKAYEAEFEELHDDLVVDFLMLAWWALKRQRQIPERDLTGAGAVDITSYEPMSMLDTVVEPLQMQNEFGPQGLVGGRRW